jgi:VCBS repeat-containing protein
MRSNRLTRKSKTRRRDTSRRNFLKVECLEHRMVLTGMAPIAVNDLYDAVMDEPLSITSPGILANDTDTDLDALTASLWSGPANGTIDLAGDGSFTYTPNSGFTGMDSFVYSASDGDLNSGLAAVTIHVGDGNQAPTAGNDAYETDEDTALSIDAPGILGNDSDPDGDPLSILAGDPLHGSLAWNPDGSFTYTPLPGFNGLDGFSYWVSDGSASSAVATVSINVNPVNDNPSSVNDEYTVIEDTTLNVVPPGVLGNDFDPDSDPLSAVLVDGPQHGTLTLNSDGSVSYTPEANFTGTDGFSYLASDGTGNSEVASVTINVTPMPDAPTAGDDSYSTDEGVALTIDAPGVLANDADGDGDALTAQILGDPANGVVALNADGSFTYTPNDGFSGVDTFTYQAGDGVQFSPAATVTINVDATNDAPDAVDDALTVAEDGSLNLDIAGGVLANDTDPEGDALIATLVSGPANGTLTLNPDGSLQYAPNANFNGTDSFTYSASDGELSDEATVTINVTPENDPPLAVADGYTTTEDTVLSIGSSGVLSNDSDVDGDALTATLVSGPANGSVTLNPDGSFDYTPSADFSGTDSFTYSASDGTASAEATVTITVDPAADNPTANADAYSTGEDVPLAVGAEMGVLANDVDSMGGPLTAELVSGPEHGTLMLNSDGSFSYTPEANWNGSVTFTYKAIGADGETTGTATVTIQALNDAPVAANDEFNVVNDPVTPGAGNVLTNDSDVDGDTMTAAMIQGPEHGEVTLNADGTFSYTPETGFVGDDTFTYQLNDGLANSNVATVTLHVSEPTTTPPANTRPTAANDSFEVMAGAVLDVAAAGVLTNDTDAEGNALTANLFGDGPLHGSISFNADGSFSYTPEEGFTGIDAFMYWVFDGELNSALAAVTLHVLPAAIPEPIDPIDPCEPEPVEPPSCEPAEPVDPCAGLDLLAADEDLLDLLAEDQCGEELPPCGIDWLA